jgi:hypothetical protein
MAKTKNRISTVSLNNTLSLRRSAAKATETVGFPLSPLILVQATTSIAAIEGPTPYALLFNLIAAFRTKAVRYIGVFYFSHGTLLPFARREGAMPLLRTSLRSLLIRFSGSKESVSLASTTGILCM